MIVLKVFVNSLTIIMNDTVQKKIIKHIYFIVNRLSEKVFFGYWMKIYNNITREIWIL